MSRHPIAAVSISLIIMLVAATAAAGEGEPRVSPGPDIEIPQEGGDDVDDDEEPGEPEPAEPDLSPQDQRRISDRVKELYFARKRAFCSTCDGRSVVRCAKCKGEGYIYAYYPNIKKIDWDKTKVCGKCEKAGLLDCTRRSCISGFEDKYLRRILWDIRSIEYQQDLEKTLGVGEAYIEGFLKGMAHMNHIGAESDEEDDDIEEGGLPGIAREMGVDSMGFAEFVITKSSYRRLLAPFTKFKAVEVGPVSKVRVRELKNGKVAREYYEETLWVKQGDDWFLEKVREAKP